MTSNQTDESVDDERHKLIGYLDNATIINACTVLEQPEAFDPYKLLDLESFCQALLFYDSIRTLVGHSFAWGFSRDNHFSRSKPADQILNKDLSTAEGASHRLDPTARNAWSEEQPFPNAARVYRSLIDRGLLCPVVLSAGTFRYYVENLRELDAVSRGLDIDRIVSEVTAVFGDLNPWRDPDPVRDGPIENDWDSIVLGGWPLSDSYPIYYFKQRNAEADTRGELGPAGRRTSWLETFISQTYFYVATSASHRKSYLCSSTRIPVVARLITDFNRQLDSIVNASISTITSETRRKVEIIQAFFGNGMVQIWTLPALFAVLRTTTSRHDFVAALLDLRTRSDVAAFRTWCRKFELAWESQNVDEIMHFLSELGEVTAQLAGSLETSPIDGVLGHIPDLVGMVTTGAGQTTVSDEVLARSAMSPSLTFAKDIGSYIGELGKNRGAVEDLFERRLRVEDETLLAQLAARRNRLYPPGTLPKQLPRVHVSRMEIMTGDVFKNVQGSIIATRGSIARGVVSIQAKGQEDVARAIAELDRLISGATDTDLPPGKRNESAELLSGIAEEAGKPQPNRTILKTLGTSLVEIISAVGPIAQASREAVGVLQTLWS